MIRIIRSEFYRIRHTSLIWIHLIVPIFYTIMYLFLAKTTGLKNYPKEDIIKTFLALLSVGFPIIIGAITAKTSGLEMSAGNFKVFLTATISRTKAYISKLIVLLIGGIFATIIAIFLFALLFQNQNILDYLIETILIFVGTIGIYIINLWVSIAIGPGASIGLGFVGALLAGLSLTGLGDRIWYYIPYTWPSRLSLTYMITNDINMTLMKERFIKWSIIAITVIIILLILSLVWFNRWDGKAYTD